MESVWFVLTHYPFWSETASFAAGAMLVKRPALAKGLVSKLGSGVAYLWRLVT